MPRTTTTCPDLCQNPHNEQPGDVIHHYWPAASIPQSDNGRPVRVFVGYYEHDKVMRLEIGGFSFDLPTARMLLAELGLKVEFADRQQTILDVDAHLDGLLDRYQVTGQAF